MANHAVRLGMSSQPDNGLYEVTGGQPVAGSGKTDFAGLARAAGIERVYAFDDLAQWKASRCGVLTDPERVLFGLECKD